MSVRHRLESVFATNWNCCSPVTGMGVRAALESVFDGGWNTHAIASGFKDILLFVTMDPEIFENKFNKIVQIYL